MHTKNDAGFELIHPDVSIFQQNDRSFQRYLGPLLGPVYIYLDLTPLKIDQRVHHL